MAQIINNKRFINYYLPNLKPPGSPILLDDELEEVKSIVKDIMENTFKLSVPLKVEMEVGNDWYEAK